MRHSSEISGGFWFCRHIKGMFSVWNLTSPWTIVTSRPFSTELHPNCRGEPIGSWKALNLRDSYIETCTLDFQVSKFIGQHIHFFGQYTHRRTNRLVMLWLVNIWQVWGHP